MEGGSPDNHSSVDGKDDARNRALTLIQELKQAILVRKAKAEISRALRSASPELSAEGGGEEYSSVDPDPSISVAVGSAQLPHSVQHSAPERSPEAAPSSPPSLPDILQPHRRGHHSSSASDHLSGRGSEAQVESFPTKHSVAEAVADVRMEQHRLEEKDANVRRELDERCKATYSRYPSSTADTFDPPAESSLMSYFSDFALHPSPLERHDHASCKGDKGTRSIHQPLQRGYIDDEKDVPPNSSGHSSLSGMLSTSNNSQVDVSLELLKELKRAEEAVRKRAVRKRASPATDVEQALGEFKRKSKGEHWRRLLHASDATIPGPDVEISGKNLSQAEPRKDVTDMNMEDGAYSTTLGRYPSYSTNDGNVGTTSTSRPIKSSGFASVKESINAMDSEKKTALRDDLSAVLSALNNDNMARCKAANNRAAMPPAGQNSGVQPDDEVDDVDRRGGSNIAAETSLVDAPENSQGRVDGTGGDKSDSPDVAHIDSTCGDDISHRKHAEYESLIYSQDLSEKGCSSRQENESPDHSTLRWNMGSHGPDDLPAEAPALVAVADSSDDGSGRSPGPMANQANPAASESSDKSELNYKLKKVKDILRGMIQSAMKANPPMDSLPKSLSAVSDLQQYFSGQKPPDIMRDVKTDELNVPDGEITVDRCTPDEDLRILSVRKSKYKRARSRSGSEDEDLRNLPGASSQPRSRRSDLPSTDLDLRTLCRVITNANSGGANSEISPVVKPEPHSRSPESWEKPVTARREFGKITPPQPLLQTDSLVIFGVHFFSPEEPFGCNIEGPGVEFTLHNTRYGSIIQYFYVQLFRSIRIPELAQVVLRTAEGSAIGALLSRMSKGDLPNVRLPDDWEHRMLQWTNVHLVPSLQLGLFAKFTQNKSLQTMLLETGSELLIYACGGDLTWGVGLTKAALTSTLKWYGISAAELRNIIQKGGPPLGGGVKIGRNVVGSLLMELRELLRVEVSGTGVYPNPATPLSPYAFPAGIRSLALASGPQQMYFPVTVSPVPPSIPRPAPFVGIHEMNRVVAPRMLPPEIPALTNNITMHPPPHISQSAGRTQAPPNHPSEGSANICVGPIQRFPAAVVAPGTHDVAPRQAQAVPIGVGLGLSGYPTSSCPVQPQVVAEMSSPLSPLHTLTGPRQGVSVPLADTSTPCHTISGDVDGRGIWKLPLVQHAAKSEPSAGTCASGLVASPASWQYTHFNAPVETTAPLRLDMDFVTRNPAFSESRPEIDISLLPKEVPMQNCHSATLPELASPLPLPALDAPERLSPEIPARKVILPTPNSPVISRKVRPLLGTPSGAKRVPLPKRGMGLLHTPSIPETAETSKRTMEPKSDLPVGNAESKQTPLMEARRELRSWEEAGSKRSSNSLRTNGPEPEIEILKVWDALPSTSAGGGASVDTSAGLSRKETGSSRTATRHSRSMISSKTDRRKPDAALKVWDSFPCKKDVKVEGSSDKCPQSSSKENPPSKQYSFLLADQLASLRSQERSVDHAKNSSTTPYFPSKDEPVDGTKSSSGSGDTLASSACLPRSGDLDGSGKTSVGAVGDDNSASRAKTTKSIAGSTVEAGPVPASAITPGGWGPPPRKLELEKLIKKFTSDTEGIDSSAQAETGKPKVSLLVPPDDVLPSK